MIRKIILSNENALIRERIEQGRTYYEISITLMSYMVLSLLEKLFSVRRMNSSPVNISKNLIGKKYVKVSKYCFQYFVPISACKYRNENALEMRWSRR